MAGQVHLAVVPPAEPQPERRRLQLRNRQLDIELYASTKRLEIALCTPSRRNRPFQMLAFANAALAECRLSIDKREEPSYCRLWSNHTAFAISADEAAQIREAFPELRVQERTEVGS